MGVLSRAALLMLVAGPAAAHEDPALYRCRVYLTGTDQRTRPAGLARCVRDVLVKLSGTPALADDPRPIDPAGMIEDFAYLDRMTDQPTHDEQGTRDRPFDLVAHVDPQAAQRLLREWGGTPWLKPRPRLLVTATITRNGVTFPLTADGGDGERQRQAVLAAGETYGMRVALPTYEQARQNQPAPGTGQALQGSLIWSDADFGWVAAWRMDGAAWDVRGVSFDEAFRAGVGGAASRLAR